MKLLHWFDGYLSKPVRVSELKESIIRITGEVLDLEAADAESASEPAEAQEEKKKDLDILIAEDHFVNQELFKSILEKMGYSVDVANDGKEALTAAGEKSFDIIFMDIQMPNMNGLEATQSIRKLGIETPIVAVSANAIKEEMENAIAIGINDFITKPFKKKDLVPVIAKWAPVVEKAGSADDSEPAQVEELESHDPEPPIFDFETAVETFMGKREVVVRVVGDFLPKVEGELKQLKQAYQSGDFEAIRNLAHSIKGGSLNLEMMRVGQSATALEQAGRDKSKNEAYTNLKALIENYKDLKTFVKKNVLQPG